MKQNLKNFKLGTIIRAALTLAIMLTFIFLPAGTLRWPEAWIFLSVYLSMISGILIWLKKNSPDLLKERMSKKKQAKTWDKIIIRIYSLLLIFLLGIPGLDAVRYGWSEVPWIVKVLGFAGYIPALLLTFWVMKENAFSSNVVRIQNDRGHTVCTTGPYRFVRHPMYVGVILICVFIPLSLGSLYALIPSALIIILFILRTFQEDRTLHEELPGYKEYAQRVLYRLLPGVW
ncbi:MAG: isoprenylcysteine carboxylmethyltransferase family protein [Candidatus Aminicenantes bacterium]|nr:isoprenylcysteine carboxylmethyltransferase family protein [Candidatus Aminicenantes bacterium]